MYEAFAWLKPGLVPETNERSNLYGNSDGSGTAPFRGEAVYRAISEALERWAWRESLAEQRCQLRFDLDASTNGFAAFPGLLRPSPRMAAYFEAAERWSIGAWWEGKVGASSFTSGWPGVSGLEIQSGIPGAAVVVLWKQLGDLRAYGFAAAGSPEVAAKKASVELGRNLQVLEFYQSSGSLPRSQNERRLVHFASKAGAADFDKRIGVAVNSPVAAPTLVVDESVKGPWTKYTHVWRCLFDPAALYDNGDDDYFHF